MSTWRIKMEMKKWFLPSDYGLFGTLWWFALYGEKHRSIYSSMGKSVTKITGNTTIERLEKRRNRPVVFKQTIHCSELSNLTFIGEFEEVASQNSDVSAWKDSSRAALENIERKRWENNIYSIKRQILFSSPFYWTTDSVKWSILLNGCFFKRSTFLGC